VPDQTEWVCPQCNFSSVNASDFQRRRESLASVTTAVVTPDTSAVTALLSASPHTSESSSKIEDSSIFEEARAFASKSTLVDSTLEPNEAATSAKPYFRSGLSASGVPLASLTDASLLENEPMPLA
jgi:glycogenin glucosyltransferase